MIQFHTNDIVLYHGIKIQTTEKQLSFQWFYDKNKYYTLIIFTPYNDTSVYIHWNMQLSSNSFDIHLSQYGSYQMYIYQHDDIKEETISLERNELTSFPFQQLYFYHMFKLTKKDISRVWKTSPSRKRSPYNSHNHNNKRSPTKKRKSSYKRSPNKK